MRLIQLPVEPTPPGVSLKGKTAIVTGATAGIGQETARQLLTLQISTLVLAVRSVDKGEEVKKLFLGDATVRHSNPDVIISVMKVDMDDYQSVKEFAKAVESCFDKLDLLVLNAGIGATTFELSSSGHEQITQVNYLSNAVLLLMLLPLLEVTATKTGESSRVTWVGSRRHYKSSLVATKPIASDCSVLDHFDERDNFYSIPRYGDSKLLCVMFMYELAKRVSPDKVILNQICPGMTYTSIGDFLILPLRVLFHVVHVIFARSVEQAGWLVVNAAAVAGSESHGQFLVDKDIREPDAFISSQAGQEVQTKLWAETLHEAAKLGIDVPDSLKAEQS